MNAFESISENVINLFNDSGWVKWIHEGTRPAYTQEDKVRNFVYGAISNHCAVCLNLNGCCFPKNKMPQRPLHPKCHCKVISISNMNFEAVCKLEKFTKYIFDPQKNNGKKALFESWGYSKIDSEWLQKEFCRQAKEKYATGDFYLDRLDSYGQRINIIIEIPLQRKGENTVIKFESGWMVYPNGKITLVTPFGRRVQ